MPLWVDSQNTSTYVTDDIIELTTVTRNDRSWSTVQEDPQRARQPLIKFIDQTCVAHTTKPNIYVNCLTHASTSSAHLLQTNDMGGKGGKKNSPLPLCVKNLSFLVCLWTTVIVVQQTKFNKKKSNFIRNYNVELMLNSTVRLTSHFSLPRVPR